MKTTKDFMRCAYLNEQGLSTNGIGTDLKSHVFNGHSYHPVTADIFNGQQLAAIDVLVLPGINGEHSPYPKMLNAENSNTLRTAIEKGMVLVTFCAASYYMFDKIFYETRDGQIKNTNGLGLIRGTAKQAFRHITRQNDRSLSRDYIEAGITSPYFDGEHHLLNVNGPAFHLDRAEAEICLPFLNYTETMGAAAVIKQFGKGLIIALGVHPELSSLNSDHYKELQFPNHDIDRMVVLNALKEIIAQHFRSDAIVTRELVL